MKRTKKHKIKHDMPEASTSYTKDIQEHDLAYYIHDRVELMHQVFSVIKSKDLRAMAPECVRNISVDDLQELCTEELLGISSKRLCAILDGAEPPSDTESSSSSHSPEQLETISLDSISSDEEILSQTGKKKKHKHKRRDSKSSKMKAEKKKSKERTTEGEEANQSKASRAGLTVLELLELQARARAIRAQLHKEQANKPPPATSEAEPTQASSSSSENEVEIKEEPAEVLVISSDDDKPTEEELKNALSCNEKESSRKEKEKAKKDKKKDKSKKSRKDKEKSTSKDPSTTSDDSKENSKETTKETAENTEPISKDTEKVTNEAPTIVRSESQTVTKRINDLVITVPHQTIQKIKLNRQKVTVSTPSNADKLVTATKVNVPVTENNARNVTPVISSKNSRTEVNKVSSKDRKQEKIAKKDKQRKKKREQRISTDKDSDHDEITLELSDSEKMDLLGDLDRKNYEKVSSSSSEDSESSSDTDTSEVSSQNSSKDTNTSLNNTILNKTNNSSSKSNDNNAPVEAVPTRTSTNEEITENTDEGDKSMNHIEEKDKNLTNDELFCRDHYVLAKEVSNNTKTQESSLEKNDNNCSNTNDANSEKSVEVTNENSNANLENVTTETEILEVTENVTEKDSSAEKLGFVSEDQSEKAIEIENINDIPVRDDSDGNPEDVNMNSDDNTQKPANTESIEVCDTETVEKTSSNENKDTEKDLSEGEISEHESSEVEAIEPNPEVVCISDDEGKDKKKKKKKDKKKKSKKEDFRESGDQNFYKDSELVEDSNLVENFAKNNTETDHEREDKGTLKAEDVDEQKPTINLIEGDIDDDVYEILELSDDSSCYEVEGTVLSKEPTVEEIVALSAKIDEIEREDIITEEEIRQYERKDTQENTKEERIENVDNISWKDRYLDSKKVKKVLTTANILNALRKKNKELKRKLEESKKEEELTRKLQESEKKEVVEKVLEEGSIEHYNTLEGSTNYVDPVKEVTKDVNNGEQTKNNEQVTGNNGGQTENNGEETVNIVENKDSENIVIDLSGEMKKDAKQLLKIYKKLLKYNDINKQKDPSKKKKKKKSKKKVKDT